MNNQPQAGEHALINDTSGRLEFTHYPDDKRLSLLDAILALPDKDALLAMWQNPAYIFSVITVLNKVSYGGALIMGGLGVDDGYIHLPDDQIGAYRLVKLLDLLTDYPPRLWRGLDLFRCGKASLKIAAVLHPMSKFITQELLDFMLCADLDATPGLVISAPSVDWEAYVTISEDDAALAQAFRAQMIAEAEPFRHQIAAGAYVMEREPFPRLDQEIDYEQMRLVIRREGIFGSLYMPARHPLVEWSDSDDQPVARRKPTPLATPFVWTPEGVNTGQVWLSARGVFALDVLLACIWRDACIVKEKFVEQKRARGYEDRKRNAKSRNVVVLPRVIYRTAWGVDQGERDQAIAQARAAHARGGCYPRLPKGYVAHDAEARAAAEKMPPPPPGHTFRKPYTTSGEKPAAFGSRPVICRGLQVAHQVLG